jgi:late competence protein required for DNA uptake (superfamily II DNA/RNA helicase)
MFLKVLMYYLEEKVNSLIPRFCIIVTRYYLLTHLKDTDEKRDLRDTKPFIKTSCGRFRCRKCYNATNYYHYYLKLKKYLCSLLNS